MKKARIFLAALVVVVLLVAAVSQSLATSEFVQMKKNANTAFTREYLWDIDKWADATELTLSTGQTHLVNYSVKVETTDVSDAGWAVAGRIWVIVHPPGGVSVTDVQDIVSPNIVAAVLCEPLPYAIPPIEQGSWTLECTYSAELPDDQVRTNTATATVDGQDYTATASVDFTGATLTEIDRCVTVYDNGELLGEVCVGDAPKTFTYSRSIGPYEECGTYQVKNTAFFVTSDTETRGEASWIIAIDVPCVDGCTLTPGYWKTHSDYGPAPYDSTWALIGEDTPFFLSDQSYYQVLWTPPAGGNAYYILAHAYIAAELNFLNGADPTAAQAAFDAATELFEDNTSAEVRALRGNDQLRQQFLALAETLDQYNNGIIGPGACSE